MTDASAARLGGAREAMQAVTRLLSGGVDLRSPAAVRSQLVSEARRLFEVTRALLVQVELPSGRVHLEAASPADHGDPGRLLLTELPALHDMVVGALPALTLEGEAAARIDGALGAASPAGTVMLLSMRSRQETRQVLVLADDDTRRFSREEVEVAGAFSAAAAASLGQVQLAEERAAQVVQQAALARAAKSLNESLDLNHVLVRICQDAAGILDGDNAVVYRGAGGEGMTVEATFGLPPEAIGHRIEPGEGLAARVAELECPLVTNDHERAPGGADRTLFGEVRSCAAVPIHWDGELRGVLAVGYKRRQVAGAEQVALLEACGELAAVACRNASMHFGLAQAARTDGLTGCLNHSAMHEALRREIGRCERSGQRLSLVLVDMDDFKRVNEEHGHLAGDEVLRRVGHTLRQSVRQYDLVARYGGDEFTIVTAEAGEQEAAEVAGRALAGLAAALGELDTTLSASAGVAEWAPGETSTGLLSRADRALLYGKHEGFAGTVVSATDVPERFGSGRFRRREAAPAPVQAAPWPEPGREQSERLRKRARDLALANQLGIRLAGMTDPRGILDAAADALDRAFGYFLCAVMRVTEDDRIESAVSRGPASMPPLERRWSQARGEGLIGRCLRERRTVVVADVRDEPEYTSAAETCDVCSELVAPICVGGKLWGAIDIEEVRAHAFDADDARLVQTVADQVGAALYSAFLYERLDRAYVDTAEALAAALESKESYSATHARAVVERTAAVGRRLGLGPSELRTLRLGAIFHDIGKITVPERILNKQGPLTDAERREIERHPVMGERILSSVEFLSDVRPLVRHEHERWDGRGYPDGLADEDIPFGSRIIHACEAYDAMTSDRPYRPAMSDDEARVQLLAGAGTQFDERVVAALLE